MADRAETDFEPLIILSLVSRVLELQVCTTMFDMSIFIHFTATQCQFQAGS